MSTNYQQCERCGLVRPNCGPWREDGKRFALICGPCKDRATFTPERMARMGALVEALAVEVARQEKAEAIDTVGVEVGVMALDAHPTGCGACDPEEAPCSGCAAAYSEAWAEPDGDDGADVLPESSEIG